MVTGGAFNCGINGVGKGMGRDVINWTRIGDIEMAIIPVTRTEPILKAVSCIPEISIDPAFGSQVLGSPDKQLSLSEVARINQWFLTAQAGMYDKDYLPSGEVTSRADKGPSESKKVVAQQWMQVGVRKIRIGRMILTRRYIYIDHASPKNRYVPITDMRYEEERPITASLPSLKGFVSDEDYSDEYFSPIEVRPFELSATARTRWVHRDHVTEDRMSATDEDKGYLPGEGNA